MAIITVSGYVGSADYKITPSGTQVLNVSIADKRWNYKEEIEETVWIKAAWFGERAEKLANSIPMAKIMTITGKENYKIYDGKIDRTMDPMEHSILQFKSQEDKTTENNNSASYEQYPPLSDSDLPF